MPYVNGKRVRLDEYRESRKGVGWREAFDYPPDPVVEPQPTETEPEALTPGQKAARTRAANKAIAAAAKRVTGLDITNEDED